MLNIFKEPFTDDKLQFNETTKHYELTKQEIKENFEIPFSSDAVLERRIKKNSSRVYSYILQNSNSRNADIVKWLINNTTQGRRFIYDALISQMESDLATGFNSLADQPQIDLKSGRVVKTEDMLNAGLISVATKMIIDNSPSYFGGINITCAAEYGLGIKQLYWRNK